MPNSSFLLKRQTAVHIVTGTKGAHVQGKMNQKFQWVESATEPTVESIKNNGAINNEVFFPEGWSIWAIACSNLCEVTVNTAS